LTTTNTIPLVFPSCEKIIQPQPPRTKMFQNVSEYEKSAAEMVIKNYDVRNRMRYEVVRAKVDTKTAQFHS
jgi:hypothetical protein